MTEANPDPQRRLPLSPAAFSILLALTGGEKHGYAILRAVSEKSDGAVKLLPGTLYNLLKRMLDDGWIVELGERPHPVLDDERRRYYRLTGVGEQIAALEAGRMAELVRLARSGGLLDAKEEI